MTSSPLPSGQQLEIRHGNQLAVVTSVGATLRRYAVGADEVLDGFDEDEMCSAGRGQHLIPWPNRVRDGEYVYAGVTQKLPLSEPAHHNAIHGLARWADWSVVDHEDAEVTLGLTVFPQPGWPGILDLRLTTRLGDDGLTVTTTATNVGGGSVPYGSGSHPYFTLATPLVDAVTMTLPAATYLLPDDRGIPVDPQPVAGTAYDFRTPSPVGDLVLDTAYTDVSRDPDGRWRVHLSTSGSDRTTAVWGDAAYSWLQVFTGDTLPAGKARTGIAVEPMTCGPDAFNTGAGLVELAPGERHEGTWGISAS